MGTGGIEGVLGGITAFQLSVIQAGIGIPQIVAELSNKSIPQGNTVPRMIAYYSGSDYAALIDATAPLLPSVLTPNIPANISLAKSSLFITISGIDRGLNTAGFVVEGYNLLNRPSINSDINDYKIDLKINVFKDDENM